MGNGKIGRDEGKSNYSILGGVQHCGVSLPPLSFLIAFIGLYRELLLFCLSARKEIRHKIR